MTKTDRIAAEIHRTWGATRDHQIAAWEGYLATGHLLTRARAEFVGDREYGRWFQKQDFGFSPQWGRRLRLLADHDDDVRRLLDTAVTGMGVNAVLAELGLLGGTASRSVGVEDFTAWHAANMARIAELEQLADAATDVGVIFAAIDEVKGVEAEYVARQMRARSNLIRALVDTPGHLRPEVARMLTEAGATPEMLGWWPS